MGLPLAGGLARGWMTQDGITHMADSSATESWLDCQLGERGNWLHITHQLAR